ncbi:unnamed protein product [Brassicogethes aeneus]|uniref:Cytochrome c oxidase subunit 4 n=1 Tax=Brassicogethes aeneus TaxID=1431903 RepID=A0A9P0AYH2_BRAAE|nr:unnamed protein product [Brassicogethes aeneus]
MGIEFNRDKYWLDRIGTREVVGYGINGQPVYFDMSSFPFPAIRYKEPTREVQALLEKQKCDWRLLTIEEKRELYRINFCRTFSEFQASTSEWMEVVGYGLIMVSLGVWIWIFLRLIIDHEVPKSYRDDWILEQNRRKLNIRHEPILGFSSYYDYKKKDWKKGGWMMPPNPYEGMDEEEGEGTASK